MGGKWHLIVVLIFISLMANGVKHIFLCVCVFCHFHVLLREMSSQVLGQFLDWLIYPFVIEL